MIVKDEFLNKLRRDFGLNLYEVKIWVALLSRGISTAGELSDIGNVPRSRAYDVLESLEQKGFIILKLGKPIKYLAVDPKEVVERVKKIVKKDSDERIQNLEKVKTTDVLEELEILHKQGVSFVESADLSGAIKGRQNVYSQLELMLKNAEKSVSIMTTTKGLIRKLSALRSELERLSKKGVKIRIAAPINSEDFKEVKEFMKIAEVKHTNEINARFFIVDGRDLMFMIMDDENIHPSYDVGVWINTPFFATALDELFDLSWKEMESAEKVLAKIKK